MCDSVRERVQFIISDGSVALGSSNSISFYELSRSAKKVIPEITFPFAVIHSDLETYRNRELVARQNDIAEFRLRDIGDCRLAETPGSSVLRRPSRNM